MAVICRNGCTLVVVVLVLAVVACGPDTTNGASRTSDTIAAAPPTQLADVVLWGRVPYCNCFAGSATVNVANALKEAKLTVNLKELSPRDGWLYFAVTFDPATAPGEQVSDAMVAGGAELLDGPP